MMQLFIIFIIIIMENQLLTLIDEGDYYELNRELHYFFTRDRDAAIHWHVDYIKTRLNDIANISFQELLALPFIIKDCTEYCIVSTENLLIIANAIVSHYNYSTISNEQDLDDAVDYFYDLSIENGENFDTMLDALNIIRSIIDERHEYYEIYRI